MVSAMTFKGHSRSSGMSPFDRELRTSYYSSIVTMALSSTILEIYWSHHTIFCFLFLCMLTPLDYWPTQKSICKLHHNVTILETFDKSTVQHLQNYIPNEKKIYRSNSKTECQLNAWCHCTSYYHITKKQVQFMKSASLQQRIRVIWFQS